MSATDKKNKATSPTEELLLLLENRFRKNMKRHSGMEWEPIRDKLLTQPEKLRSLSSMEETGGEPDVTGQEGGEFLFIDCSPESPAGRRNLCYDRKALNERKQAKPHNSAMDVAAEMGIELLTEHQYKEMQKFGPFDTKTSGWLLTPPEVRKLGGAIFGDYRYGRVFIYHNGAQSYYSSRGFRGCLRV